MGNFVDSVTDTDIYLGRIYDRNEIRKLFYPKNVGRSYLLYAGTHSATYQT
jgi:hypothetical protein